MNGAEGTEDLTKYIQDCEKDSSWDQGGAPAKSGIVAAKSGIVAAKSGIVAAKAGTVAAKAGIVAAKSGIASAKPGIASAKPGITPAKSGIASPASIIKPLAAKRPWSAATTAGSDDGNASKWQKPSAKTQSQIRPVGPVVKPPGMISPKAVRPPGSAGPQVVAAKRPGAPVRP